MAYNIILRKEILLFTFALIIFTGNREMFSKPQENRGIDEGMEKMNTALGEMSRKNYAEALKLFLQCLDQARQYGPLFSDIKNSFLMIYLRKMMKYYPPTKKALLKRYAIILEKVEYGEFRELEVDSLLELADILNKKDQLIATFDVAKKSISKKSSLEFLVKELYPILYKNKRYIEIYNNIDVLRSARDYVIKYKNEGEMYRKLAKASINKLLLEYEKILKSVNDKEKVKEIGKIIAGFQ